MPQVHLEISSIPEKDIVIIILYTSSFLMVIAFAVIIFFYLTRKRIIQKEIEKKNLQIEHQNDQLKAVIVAQETERKRIAQDLHDDICSKLNVVGLNCYLLKTPNLKPEEQLNITDIIIDLTNKALESSRKIAHNLLPPVLEKFGLDAGVRELCRDFESSKSVKISYTNTLKLELNDLERHLHVFRVLQELLNNSLRHGKATEISILMEKNKNICTCSYIDNGIGFDVALLQNQKGLGTKNIESRVRFLEGELTIKSAIGQGIKVYFTF